MRCNLPTWMRTVPDGVWHRWFAWHPVVVRGQVVWMEWVWRTITPSVRGPVVTYMLGAAASGRGDG